jgi:hypothetical protein
MTIRTCTLISIGCLLAAAVAAAQGVAPVPPQPPEPPAAPVAPAPVPVPDPAPRFGADSMDWSGIALEAQEKAQEKMMEAQEKMALAQQDMQRRIQEEMAPLQEDFQLRSEDMLKETQIRLGNLDLLAQVGPMASSDEIKARTMRAYGDNLYDRGQSALDRHRWDEALADFTQAASQAGSRADGALYWKAYTLNKLGRRDDALAAIAELRKSYAASRWLDDAKALELEVKQASGQPVSPDSQSDDDLKLMALNGLMQSDPDRALSALDGLLKSALSPKLKEQALFVLAQNSSPKAQQMLEQVARGSGNPDLQLKAINYLGVSRGRKADGQNQPNNGQMLSEIYGSTNDVNVKRAILNSLSANRDSDRLLQISKTEKAPELRLDAVRRLTAMRNPSLGDYLVAMYGSEQDKQIKRTIADSFASQDNVKQLVAVARTEHDPEMVRYIVGRLAGMKSPEASDYLMEILKK